MNKCKKDFREIKTNLFSNLDKSIEAQRILFNSLKPTEQNKVIAKKS